MINLTAVIDNTEALRKLRELKEAAKQSTSSIVTDSDRIDLAMRKIGNTLASLGLGISLTSLAKQVATVRGEFQQLEVAFSTMLSSKERADRLMAEVTDFAAKTPFDLQGVAQGTKQLLAYGSTAEEVVGELRMLGDIAAGLSIPLGDLVYLYGTTRTQGRMYTMDLRQFMGRGIPLAEELAKQFGVTKDKVGELVTAGKVGFEQMHTALVAMTSEGGKFYNLMEAQSATITGKMSNLGDAIDQMFNEIGKSSEGLIAGSIDGAIWLVENYEKVGKAIMDIVVAYGAYKAAIIVVTTWQKAEKLLLEQMAVEKALLASANHALTASQLRAAAASKLFAAAQLKVKTAIKGLGKLLTNPYVLATAAIAGTIYAVYKLVTAKSIEEQAQERVNKRIEEYNKKSDEERQKASENIAAMKNASTTTYERVRAYNDLIAKYPELLEKYDQEKLKLMEIAELEREIADISKTRLLADLDKQIADIDKKIKESEKKDKTNRSLPSGSGGSGISTDLFYNTTDAIRQEEYIAERAELIKQRNQILKDQAQADFDALPAAKKIEKYRQDVKRAEDDIKRLNNEIEQAGPLANSSLVFARNAAIKAKADAEAAISTLENQIKLDTKSDESTDPKARENALKSALKEAKDAEIALEKERIDDKVKLLEYEKEVELAAIDERLKATTDKEIKAALERQKTATSQLFDHKIAEARKKQEEDDAKLREKEEEENQRHLDNMLAQFGTYTQKRQAIIEEYAEKRKSMYATDKDGNYINDESGTPQLKEGFSRENIDILNEQEQEALTDFASDFYAENKQFKEWLNSIVGLSIAKLKVQKDALEKLLPAIADESQRGYIQAQINSINNLMSGDTTTESTTKQSERWSQLSSAINEVGTAARDALENVEGMDEGIKKLLSDTLNISQSIGSLAVAIKQYDEAFGALKQGAEGAATGAAGLATSIDGVSKAASGLEKASAILMIISAAIQAISALFTALSSTSSMDKNLRKLREFNNELRRLKEESKLYDWQDTIFGTDGFGKAAHAIDVYNEALNRFNATVDNTIDKVNSLYRSHQMGLIGPSVEFAGGTVDDLEGVLRNMLIQTRHKTWFRSAKYASLEDVLPELFGEDGVNMEALKEFMSNEMFAKLSEQNQELIKDLVSDWEIYEDALDEVREYLSNIFGDLGSEMTDALVSAFQSGTDAAKDFTESMSNMLEQFAKDMVNSLIFADLFKEAEEALLGVMKDTNLSDEAKFARYTKIFGELASESEAMQDEAFALMDALQKQAKEQGFDIFDDAEKQSATSRGFQAMSQETGSELNGRFTDIQGKMTEVRDFVFQSVIGGQNRLNELINIRDIAIQLNGNVEQIKTYSKVLPQMNDTLSAMNRKLDAL
jgi:tape measure domain-containing protein